MRGLWVLCALACAGLCAAPATAASSQTGGALSRGGTYILQADPSVEQAVVQLWFRAPASGYDNASQGIAQIAAAACAAAPLAGAKSLVGLVQSTGGQLNLNVYPDIVEISEAGPASSVRRIVAAMTAAYFSPSLDANALQAAQGDAAVMSVERRFEPRLAMADALFAQLFASGPAHLAPTVPSGDELQKVSLNDVTAFAQRAFRSSNAYLVLSGNVDVGLTNAVTDGGGAGAPDPPFDSQRSPSPQNTSAIGLIDATGLGWIGPGIGDEKAATAMDFLNDYLFRPRTGSVQAALTAAGSSADVFGQFITLHDPGVMVVTVSGPAAAAATKTVLAAVAAMTQPLDAATFERARAAFLYHIASDAQTASSAADDLGWYAAEGNAAYAPVDFGQNYLRVARSLDPQYVAQIAQRYLKSPLVVQSQTAQKAPST